jgi:gas vesicle protein
MGQESEALREDIQQRRESMTGTIDAIEDKVVPSRIIERRRAAVTGWAGGIKERVMGSPSTTAESASSAIGKLSHGVSQATEAVSDAPAQVQRATAGSPLIAGAIAFGIGALVAALLPETGPEQRAVAAVQPQLNAATEAVKDAGQQALDTAKSSSQDAAQDLKDSATSHAHEVADQAKDAGQQVKDAAAERAR